jgi:hypothetical protein
LVGRKERKRRKRTVAPYFRGFQAKAKRGRLATKQDKQSRLTTITVARAQTARQRQASAAHAMFMREEDQRGRAYETQNAI